MYRGNACQLRWITGDLHIQSEVIHQCNGELSEDGDCGFDSNRMFPLKMCPGETKVSPCHRSSALHAAAS